MTDLTDLGVAAIRDGVASGEFTAVEVAEAFNANVAAAQEALNAFIVATPEKAIEAAQATDAKRGKGESLGKMGGVPIGMKDLFATRGVQTTAASHMLEGFVPEYESTVSQKLWDAGCGMLGKLNLDQFAMGSSNETSYFGNVINPWKRNDASGLGGNASLAPGGSSGGSAAAVAAGLCDVALGPDTMGSVRIPAAYCGIYGLKPTRGAISQDGLEIAEASLDSIGPMARSLEDLEACSRVLMKWEDPQAIDNIVLLENLGKVECEPAVLEAYDKAKEILGAQTIFSLPCPLTQVRFSGFILASLALAESLSDIVKNNPDGLSDHLKHLLTYGRKRTADFLAKDRKILEQTKDALVAAVGPNGAILLPTTPQAAFSHDEKPPVNQADFTCLASVAGLPAISIPAGWNEDRLPVGVQLIGAAGNEAGLFELARKLDEKLDAYRRPETFLEIF